MQPSTTTKSPRQALVEGIAIAPHTRSHSVQFYENDDFLCETVAEFLAAGLRNGQPAVVIATQPHVEGFSICLRGWGIDLGAEQRRGRVTILDARDTLGAIVVDRLPDGEAFRTVVGGALDRSSGNADAVVCAFGEMVSLLWEEGNPEGAIRLESFWNELAESHSFSLVCAYPIRIFASAADADRFLEVCRHHDRVVPTERYTAADGDARLLEVSALQQQAQALETEIGFRRELEQRLREALAEQDLLLQLEHSARVRAEAANRAKQDFLTVMSHELRTPLNAIAGYAELLEMGVCGAVSELQRQHLARIQHSQQRLLGLIDEILVYATTESGRAGYVIVDAPMHEVLHEASLCLLPRMEEKEIDYLYPGCDAGIVARADREKVRRIVVNLLSNAAKFTGCGGRVALECDAVWREVHVRVRDTGTGIPADKLEAIFEPFVQADSGLTRVHEGAGLGPAICAEFARGMGGDIGVASRAGIGTTFTLTLPRAVL